MTAVCDARQFRSTLPLEQLSAMPDELDDSISNPSPTPPAGLTADAFSRRTLMASVIGGVSAVALAGRFAGVLRDTAKPALEQTSSTSRGSVGGTPSPVAASPV